MKNVGAESISAPITVEQRNLSVIVLRGLLLPFRRHPSLAGEVRGKAK